MSRSNWHGHLELEYGNTDLATKLVHTHTQAPFRMQRPFYPEGDRICHSIIVHTAGGVVGGDRLTSQIKLQPNTHALITNAAAAKIYRSNGQIAVQETKITVGAGACLEWLPQETIVFAGADYTQKLRIDLEPKALWLGWDLTRFGRTARGEVFCPGQWRSHCEIWQAGKPIWCDRQRLVGQMELLESSNGLARKAILGSLVLAGQPANPEIIAQIKQAWLAIVSAEQNLINYADASIHDAGVTSTILGLVCRYRGNSSHLAKQWFKQIWQLLRSAYLELPVCQPRVWQ
ncbi:Urease accessory protein ureD [Thalassoporum mexicanum PCC 7367]|uniref:urease accessory protein UreD n=1 Tax=Thalassoporum mexicanum TaxID=3457544 RepID=UPI00029FA3F9|nr:urease accessory protein UreD [Pseudanabaena sp. PCC 7367]AFY71215.1 Urease accessory protein ureD [Pseudanabaena sp. PCC 7367]